MDEKGKNSEKISEEELKVLEEYISKTDFWSDKDRAQTVIRRIQELKAELAGASKYDKGNAIVTIISGAGGDDAEDFSSMLLNMYMKYAGKAGWGISFIHEHKN